MARVGRKSRYLKETCQRCGFDNFRYNGPLSSAHKWSEFQTQKGLLLDHECYDTPPPSTLPLGGSSISRSGLRANWDTVDSPSSTVVQVTASGGITLNNQPWLQVAGESTTTNISADPQIARGRATQVIGIECVSNQILLENSNGLALRVGKPFLMDSGAIINLMYDGTDNLWRELSRGHRESLTEG